MTGYRNDMLFPILLLGCTISSLVLASKPTHTTPTIDVQTKSSPALTDEIQNDQIQEILFQAAEEVTKLHRAESYRSSNAVPELPVSPQFMHSALLGSRFYTREEISIDGISEMIVKQDVSDVKRWYHMSHNSSEVLIATTPSHLIVWRIQLEETSTFTLKIENAFAVVGPFEGEISSCVLYLHHTSFSEESLFLVVSTILAGKTDINIYRIDHFEVKHVSVLKLNETVLKMSFLEYLNKGTLILLVESAAEQAPLSLHTSGLPQAPTLLKVTVPYGLDVESFSSKGKNYIALTNSTACSIFEFGQDTVDAELFDTITMEDIVSLSSYTEGNEQFLLVAGRLTQNVFLVDTDQLIFKQGLTVTHVLNAFTFTTLGCREATVLALTRESAEDSLLVYVWRGDKFDPIAPGLVPGSVLTLPGSMTSFSPGNTTYLTLVDEPSGRIKILRFRYRLGGLVDPVVASGAIITKEMEKLEASLNLEEEHANHLNQLLSNAVHPFSHVISGQTLTDVEVTFGTKTSSISDPDVPVTWDRSLLTRDDLKANPEELQRKLDELEDRISKLERELDDVVLLSESAEISGHKDIQGMVTAPSADFGDLTLPINETFKNLLASVYRTDRHRKIKGDIRINGNLNIKDEAIVHYVNGIVLQSQVLLTSIPQEISSPVNFKNTFTTSESINFNQLPAGFNGINLDDVVTLDGPKTITAPFILTDAVQVTGSLKAPSVDGVDVISLASTALLLNREQVLERRSISSILLPSTRISEIVVTGKINGKNFNDVVRRMARRDSPANFTGNVEFHHPRFDGGLIVAGRYDGVHFPASIFRNDVEQIVSAPKHFKKLSAIALGVSGKVDGLKLPGDVFSLTGDETLTAELAMNGITVPGDLEIDGLVDGNRLTDVLSLASVPLQRKALNAVFVGKVVIERHLIIKKYSEKDIEKLREDLIFPEDTFIRLTGDRTVPLLRAPTVNLNGPLSGYNLAEDFMRTTGDQVLLGSKTFRKPVNFGQHLVTGQNRINELNIVELYSSRISIHQDSVISGSLLFSEPLLVTGDLKVTGRVNNITVPDDLVFRNGTTAVRLSNKVFRGGISTRDLSVKGDLNVSGTLDGISVEELFRRRISLSRDQKLIGSYTFGAGNVAPLVETDSVNGLDVRTLASEIVLASVPQEIFTDSVEFSGTTTVFGNLLTKEGFSGHRFQELNNRVVKLNEDLFFGGKVTFTNELVVQGDLSSLSVNGIDPVEYSQSAVRRHAGSLEGANVFLSDVHVQGNVLASTVNGVHLQKDVLLSTFDQTITGKYRFNEVLLKKDLITESTVCDLDFSELHQRVVRTDRHSILNGNLIFRQPLLVKHSVDVVGTVNDIHLSIFQDGFYSESTQPEQVLSTKVLQQPVVVIGDIVVEELNDFDLRKLLDDMVFVDRPSNIAASKVFDSPVVVSKGEVNIRGHLNVTGLVNGVHIQNWVKEIVFLNKPHVSEGDVTLIESTAVEGSITIHGKINGVNINTDALRLDTEAVQTLNGARIFSKLSTETSITVLGTVNGHHLPTLVEDTLAVHGDQSIGGEINLEGFVVFDGNVEGPVNDVDLKAEVVSIASPVVELGGRIEFNGGLTVTGDFNTKGQVCQVDVRELSETALYKDRDQVIYSPLHFEDVILTDAIVHGQVAGVDLDVFQVTLAEVKASVAAQEKILQTKSQVLETATNYLENSAKRVNALSRTLEYHQTLDVTGDVSDYFDERLEICSTGHNMSTLVSFRVQSDGQFALEGSRTVALSPLLATVHLVGSVFRLWSDKQGNVILTVSEKALLNSSGVLDADMIGYKDGILMATLHPDSCRLQRLRRNSPDSLEQDQPVVIPNIIGARTVHLVGEGESIYVGIDTSPHNDLAGLCLSPSSTSLLLYSWDVESGNLHFVQQFSGAAKRLAHIVHNGFEYLVKAERDTVLPDYPSAGIKLYRKYKTIFNLVSVFGVPNIQDVDVFEDLDNQVYVAVTNSSHLILGYLAGARGFLVHSSVPSRRAFGVRALLADEGTVFLAVGQTMQASDQQGTVQFFKFSSVGLKHKQRRKYRRWA